MVAFALASALVLIGVLIVSAFCAGLALRAWVTAAAAQAGSACSVESRSTATGGTTICKAAEEKVCSCWWECFAHTELRACDTSNCLYAVLRCYACSTIV